MPVLVCFDHTAVAFSYFEVSSECSSSLFVGLEYVFVPFLLERGGSAGHVLVAAPCFSQQEHKRHVSAAPVSAAEMPKFRLRLLRK